MSVPEGVSRRGVFVRLGLLFNGAVGLALSVPVFRYLLSPVLHARRASGEAWVSLGPVARFPPRQTRLATYQNPVARPSDGATAELPCWVRHTEGQSFQVFAINCAHLGCPVRWFPQSGLFMCPCHGGVYYADGSVAAGPPPHPLSQYNVRIRGDDVEIHTGPIPIG
jgi:Rieske Fe-S protein